ncbi:unnamed protein product [Dracunculus medinensis]|uniref:DUF268 domain-containing protein n=1 Tax=Dracunculus medinensis TaxID=318479 RepID=A0A0N4ULY1_DRAME|nr:unnamed protein product [Dracunculus medinensis]
MNASGIICLSVRNFIKRTIQEKELYIKTAKGLAKYDDLEKEIFVQHGYHIKHCEEPFPILEQLKKQTCAEVYTDWFKVAKKYDPNLKPPEEIPQSYRDMFTMNGHAIATKHYFDDRGVSVIPIWTEMFIAELLKNHPYLYKSYGDEGKAVHVATKAFSVQDKVGLVIGSISPWVEVMCLRNGAKKVITVDYYNLTIRHPQMQYYHALQLAKNWANYSEAFDFIVTFSSIEHSGLGRFGDPIDPLGDIREMRKIRCLLNNNGFLFLGIPIGVDRIHFNADRVYGQIRLAMLLEGFKIIGIFLHEEIVEMKNIKFGFEPRQYLFVLKKTPI